MKRKPKTNHGVRLKSKKKRNNRVLKSTQTHCWGYQTHLSSASTFLDALVSPTPSQGKNPPGCQPPWEPPESAQSQLSIPAFVQYIIGLVPFKRCISVHLHVPRKLQFFPCAGDAAGAWFFQDWFSTLAGSGFWAARQENPHAAGAAACAGFSAKGREPVLTEGFYGKKKIKNKRIFPPHRRMCFWLKPPWLFLNE